MTTPTPPAVSEAMREAEALVDGICAKLGYGTRLVSLRWAVASEIARLTGERDDALGAAALNLAQLKNWRRRAEAAEAETVYLRAAFRANLIRYAPEITHADIDAMLGIAEPRAALTSQEQADV